MATVVGSGTIAATGVAQTVISSELQATFQPWIRLNNLAGGDTVVVRLKTKIGTGGTLRTIYQQSYTGAQAAPNLVQIGAPVPSGWYFEVEIEQTAGTLRSFDWRLDAIGSVIVTDSGSQVIANTVETTVFTTAANGTYVFVTDLGAMTGSESLTLRTRAATLSGGTKEVAYEYTPSVAGAQATPDILMQSIPIPGSFGMDATIQQAHSNSRSYPWAVYQVAA